MRKISQGIMSFLEKAVVFFTVLFLILFALIFVLLLYFFGFAGFFFLFQVEYESLTVLLLYVIFYRLDCESFCHDMQRKRKKLPLLHDY